MTNNAMTSNDYSNLNQPKAEKIQSVSYAINVTVVEPSAINYAQNITPLDSSYSYFPTVGSSLINFATNVTALDSHDFEWSASDNPSEITCLPTVPAMVGMFCISFCSGPVFFLVSPCIVHFLYNHWKKVSSQRVKITDTQIDFEHASPRCCCCLNPESKTTYHINLKDVRMIHNISDGLEIKFFVGAGKSEQTSIRLDGFVSSSNTPGLIKDAIVQRRPKQPQTTRYTIPHITNTYKSHTITLNPHHNTVDYKGKGKDRVAFIDGLGSIDMHQGGRYADSRLEFWSPPVGRPRRGSGDSPEMFVRFFDDRSCLAFKHAIESSRNSF